MEKIINFWNNIPCNINNSNEPIGTKKFFEEVSKRKYFVESHILKFVNFPKYKNKKVLEIGCGIGTDAQSFIESGAFYTGIDISNKSIEITQKRFEIFNLSGKLINANIEEFVLNEKFDLIYSFGVLHHTLNINKALKNIKQMLKENGIFKLMLYARNSWKFFKIQNNLDQYEAQNNVPIANTYTKEEVYELLKDFNNIEINQTHIFPYKIKEYKEHKYVKEDYFEVMPTELFQCLEKNLGWHLLITCTN